MINAELDRLFPQPIEILAEPGRFLVASAATAVSQIIGKAVRGGKVCCTIPRAGLAANLLLWIVRS
jgi:ornithine decarboxylase